MLTLEHGVDGAVQIRQVLVDMCRPSHAARFHSNIEKCWELAYCVMCLIARNVD